MRDKIRKDSGRFSVSFILVAIAGIIIKPPKIHIMIKAANGKPATPNNNKPNKIIGEISDIPVDTKTLFAEAYKALVTFGFFTTYNDIL